MLFWTGLSWLEPDRPLQLVSKSGARVYPPASDTIFVEQLSEDTAVRMVMVSEDPKIQIECSVSRLILSAADIIIIIPEYFWVEMRHSSPLE